MRQCYWIWYPGDFELYHAMKQNFSRVERGYTWPAFWKSEGFRNRVVFQRTYLLKEDTSFLTVSRAAGFCLVKGRQGKMSCEKKYPFGTRISCGPGEVSISIHAACIEEFPSVFIDGDVIYSDGGWMVHDYAKEAVSAGYCRYFTKPSQNPVKWDYSEKIYQPLRVTDTGEGVLFEFETELTAVIQVESAAVKLQSRQLPFSELTVFCGESREEALDLEHCYYSFRPDPETGKTPCCALRFAFIPGFSPDAVNLYAIHQYVDIPVRAEFHCDDELVNRIWSVAEHTFQLCSGIFFIDGVKRDKWLWSGDAYQSLFVNQYLFADADISKRTLLALRGNDPVVTHINTIVDYSLFWILGVKAHFDAFADTPFVRQIYPKMCSLMEFCGKQEDENGFLIGRMNDWIFIDWADFDRQGALCAEQMLYLASFQAMSEMAAVLKEDGSLFQKRGEQLKQKIQEFYWDETKGAFIDSFVSGKKHVTRHASIFAILYNIATERQKQLIIQNVLFNPRIPAITTPYFKFYELDALCRSGYRKEVLHQIKDYWGGMLKRGAVTFWEAYDPEEPKEVQYDMYGDKFGKSLCHAWSASPIYLLAKYFAGFQVISPTEGTFEWKPYREAFEYLDAVLPAGEKQVRLHWDAGGCAADVCE